MWHARNVNETDELQKEADKLLNNPALGVRNVVMGHTHEVVNSERYINTGSWTRYYRVPEDKHLEPWTVLQSKSYTHWPYELNYAQLTAGGVQLVNYRRRAVD